MNSCTALLRASGQMSATGPAGALTAQAAQDFATQFQFASGNTGPLLTDQVYALAGTLTTGQVTTITLSALIDCFNSALAIVKLKGILLVNNGTAGSADIQIGGTTNTYPFCSTPTSTKNIKAPGFWQDGTGGNELATIVAASNDKLVLKNTGSLSQPYALYLVAASA